MANELLKDLYMGEIAPVCEKLENQEEYNELSAQKNACELEFTADMGQYDKEMFVEYSEICDKMKAIECYSAFVQGWRLSREFLKNEV